MVFGSGGGGVPKWTLSRLARVRLPQLSLAFYVMSCFMCPNQASLTLIGMLFSMQTSVPREAARLISYFVLLSTFPSYFENMYLFV